MRFLLPIFLALHLTTSAQNTPQQPTPEENQAAEKTHQAQLALLAELEAQLTVTEFDIKKLRASGLAEGHPKLVELIDQSKKLETKIQKHTPPPQETILLIEGTKSTSLTDQPNSLAQLLKQGWKINSITPAGENKAYIWLKK